MIELVAALDAARDAWRSMPLGPIERDLIRALILGAGLFCVVFAIERHYAVRTHYRSRNFAIDAVYWIYHSGGLHAFLVYAVFVAAMEAHLSELDAYLDVAVLADVPVTVQIILFLVYRDLIAYWMHRAQHRFAILWAFHTTHHSQEHLSFATTNRSHPLEAVIVSGITYVPMRIAGLAPDLGILLGLVFQFVAAVSHSRIPWRWGALYGILVSPVFHAYHHSADSAHHNRNFGVLFSFWDYLFGTAVEKGSAVPERFGLEGVASRTLWETLVSPFAVLRRRFRGPKATEAPF